MKQQQSHLCVTTSKVERQPEGLAGGHNWHGRLKGIVAGAFTPRELSWALSIGKVPSVDSGVRLPTLFLNLERTHKRRL